MVLSDERARGAGRDARNRTLPAALKALGTGGLPRRLTIGGREWTLSATLKHDFFAATGLYVGAAPTADKVILKMGRQADFLGLPLAWLGRWLVAREVRLYEMFSDLPGVPPLLGRRAKDGLFHAYVEGHSLQKGERVSDDFFPELQRLLDAVHSRDAAYVDLEKRDNILVGDDGRPYLIDFQISWHWPLRRGGNSLPARWLLRRLQAGDRYHLLKHWRRHRPDQLDEKTLASSRTVPPAIMAHRRLSEPFRRFRRKTLARFASLRSTQAGK